MLKSFPFSSRQLCVWSTDGWDKQASKFLQPQPGRTLAPVADTRVQFHQDQIHLLAIHESQIAIYEAPKLECLKQVHLPFLYNNFYVFKLLIPIFMFIVRMF